MILREDPDGVDDDSSVFVAAIPGEGNDPVDSKELISNSRLDCSARNNRRLLWTSLSLSGITSGFFLNELNSAQQENSRNWMTLSIEIKLKSRIILVLAWPVLSFDPSLSTVKEKGGN